MLNTNICSEKNNDETLAGEIVANGVISFDRAADYSRGGALVAKNNCTAVALRTSGVRRLPLDGASSLHAPTIIKPL